MKNWVQRGIKENRPRKKVAGRRFAGPQAGTRQAEGAQPQGGAIDTRFRLPGRAQPGVLRVGRAAGWRSLPGSDPAFAQGALPELAETCTHGSVPQCGIAPGPKGCAITAVQSFRHENHWRALRSTRRVVGIKVLGSFALQRSLDFKSRQIGHLVLLCDHQNLTRFGCTQNNFGLGQRREFGKQFSLRH